MKQFIRKTFLLFLIIFFILTCINLVYQFIMHYYFTTPEVIQLAESYKITGISSEEVYQTLAGVYYAGYGNKIQIQIQILVLSLILSIFTTLIIEHIKKKYKCKTSNKNI